jgi:hypothetical protein
MEHLKKLIATGNKKIPRDTAIFNMGSATDCPSFKLGLCNAVNSGVKCYAKKAEHGQWPRVLPYRRKQANFWKSIKASEFVRQFLDINSHKRIRPFNAIRFNEAGDFWSQKCVQKAEHIARMLADYGIKCYCYTSRKDLDYSKVKHLIISGSGFRKEGIANEFKIVNDVKEKPKGYVVCPMSCKSCDRCLGRGNLTVVKKH